MVITMSPEQSRMARAALGWSLTQLATEAKIGRATAARFELGDAVQKESVDAIIKAFDDAGLEIIERGKTLRAGGAGVRFKA